MKGKKKWAEDFFGLVCLGGEKNYELKKEKMALKKFVSNKEI